MYTVGQLYEKIGGSGVLGVPSMRKQLKPDAVPSLFPWTTKNKFAHERTARLLRSSDLQSDSSDKASSVSNSGSYTVEIGAEETVCESAMSDSVSCI